MDPKNITIGDQAQVQGWALQGLLGIGHHEGSAKGTSVAVQTSDALGYAVALDSDGNRMAMGVYGDDGATTITSSAGAVHLFTFSDSDFSGAALAGTIGKGYSGGKNIDVSTLETMDLFGSAVALDADGDRLAVGAPSDDGSGNGVSGSGAVYLFSFSDTSFNGGAVTARIGADYSSGKNYDLTALASYDQFGRSVALAEDSNGHHRLAVGATGDNGSSDSLDGAGAVYLFSFTDSAFTGGSLEATLGAGYTSGDNLSIGTLGEGDRFGHAVSLGYANRLAVGAPYDDGAFDGSSDAGAVYLLSFSDTTFSSGSVTATIGVGYSGEATPVMAR